MLEPTDPPPELSLAPACTGVGGSGGVVGDSVLGKRGAAEATPVGVKRHAHRAPYGADWLEIWARRACVSRRQSFKTPSILGKTTSFYLAPS